MVAVQVPQNPKNHKPNKPYTLKHALCSARFSGSHRVHSHARPCTAGMKIAVEGCCHGELDKIYAAMKHLEQVEAGSTRGCPF